MNKIFLWLTIIIFGLAGCTSAPAAVPTTTPIPATATATSAPSATALPPTATPTLAPTVAPTNTTEPTAPPPVAAEIPVTLLPLTQPAAKASAEFSGMAWYGDYLILLPQYPNFSTTHGDGVLFAIPKTDILAFLDGTRTDPLDPIAVPLVAPDVRLTAHGFEGYESIAFRGNEAFLTIEGSPDRKMMGYLIHGTMSPDLSALTLDVDSLQTIEPQAKISNFSDETLVVTPDGEFTLYEANGANVNPSPVAHVFGMDGTPQGTIPFPNMEYRITDATALDADGNFWAINYLYPGDIKKVKPAPDPLAAQFGQGKTHAASDGVERLVEFHFQPDGISLTGTPPIQLQLLPDDLRNWEGIVRLDDRGFLLATDKFPETLFGFVPFPASE